MIFIIFLTIVFAVMIAAQISSRRESDEELNKKTADALRKYQDLLHEYDEVPSQQKYDLAMKAKKEYEVLKKKNKNWKL